MPCHSLKFQDVSNKRTSVLPSQLLNLTLVYVFTLFTAFLSKPFVRHNFEHLTIAYEWRESL